jgi:hypothetical protein
MASVPPAPARPRAISRITDGDAERLPWVSQGIQAGLLGASLVALFFLVVDVLAGRPLWTPFALGAALFRGELPAPGTPVELMLVVAYTGIHATVFIGFGVPAAFQMLARATSAHPLRAGLLAILLFVGFEVVFLSLGELFAPGLTGMLGAGRVALANVLAAGAMAAFLAARAAGKG